MPRLVSSRLTYGACVAIVLGVLPAHPGAADKATATDKTKPELSVRASPAVAFSPARVVLTADLKGGANDYAEFYCSSVEWDYGDGTKSEQSADCDPYQAGKSEIKRHFAVDRVFRTSGDYRVAFRLKQKDKVVATASTTVKIRPGVREIGGQETRAIIVPLPIDGQRPSSTSLLLSVFPLGSRLLLQLFP